MNNTAFGGDTPTLPQWDGPPRAMVHVQALLFASLTASLLAALFAMLGKQWLNRYDSSEVRGSSVERSHNRQRKLGGMVAWYFGHVMESLPLMLQAALLLLGCALSRYLWEVSILVASVVLGVTLFGVFFYISIVIAGAASERCPYQTPASRALRYLWHIRGKIRHLPGKVTSFIVWAFWCFFGETSSTRKVQFSPAITLWVIRLLAAIAWDVLRVGGAVVQELIRSAYHLICSAGTTWQQQELRCISWTLQTSLDNEIRLATIDRKSVV